MDVKTAQQDMRTAYTNGATGVLASGLMWLTSAFVALSFSIKASILTLFFGGMLIYPIGILFDKLAQRSGKHAKENPLASLAFESTVILLIGIMLALAMAQIKAEFFFLITLVIIGGRYFLFQTLYGNKTYWLLGGALAALGVAAYLLNLPIKAVVFAGAIIEIVFAILIFKQ